MGINNLNINLKHCNRLIKCKYDIKEIKNKLVFIDFNSLFYTHAHVVSSTEELINVIQNFINAFLNNNNTIYLFYDSGVINKKTSEKEKRSDNSTKYFSRIKAGLIDKKIIDKDYNVLTRYTTVEDENGKPVTVEAKLTKDESKAIYSTKFNLLSGFKTEKFKIILNVLSNMNITILTKHDIDAEFYMCIIAKEKNEWPLFISKDQDLVSLIINNSPCEKTDLILGTEYYTLISDTLSKNINILTLIFNKSDYICGIHGFLFDEKKLTDEVINLLSNTSYEPFTIKSITNMMRDVFNILHLKKINKIKSSKNLDFNSIDIRILHYIYDIILFENADVKFYKQPIRDSIKFEELLKYLVVSELIIQDVLYSDDDNDNSDNSDNYNDLSYLSTSDTDVE